MNPADHGGSARTQAAHVRTSARASLPRLIIAMQTITCVVLALSLAGQATSDAWNNLRQHIGTVVLVRDAHDVETLGRLIDVTPDALTIAVGSDTQSILKTNACDVSLLRRDRAAAAGWIAGLALGGLAVGIVISKVREGANPTPFAVAGAGLGALIGMNGTQRRPIYRRAGCSKVNSACMSCSLDSRRPGAVPIFK